VVAERGTRLVFARHGESEANILGEFSNTGTKHPLTATGRAQAARLASRLADQGGVHRILASPLLRARQTAQILAERLDVPVGVDDRLREFDVGQFEGTRDQSHWEEFAAVVAAWMRDGDVDRRVGGGESHTELRARFVPLVEEVAALPGTTVLVGHGGLFLCMLPCVLSNVTVAWALAHPLTPTDTVVARRAGEHLVCSQWAHACLPTAAAGAGTPPGRPS
jgi:2,3-bisphosphoglycerate-dependent phosphoglycerate mutase